MNPSNRKLKLMLAGVLGIAVLGGVTMKFARASHAPGNGITITTLAGPALIGDIDTRSKIGDHEVKIKSKGLSDVYFAHVRIVPGGHSPWHSHPGPSILAIQSGTASVYQRSTPTVPQVVNAGESFVEDATLVHQVVNEGDTDLEFFVLQIVPFGAPRLILELDRAAPQHRMRLSCAPTVRSIQPQAKSRKSSDETFDSITMGRRIDAGDRSGAGHCVRPGNRLTQH
jgi:quercetin dioxygenase-like cupin family protein